MTKKGTTLTSWDRKVVKTARKSVSQQNFSLWFDAIFCMKSKEVQKMVHDFPLED